ncbi:MULTISPECIES: MFS transporter [Streptomyces]|uniref:MFS transporter n=1 Tax=Streptomyces TaxID=1883 RepID=UPI001EFDA3D5|nr:MFS transporter [Streptomyces sp. CBG31]
MAETNDTEGPLSHPNFRSMATGRGISTIGNGIAPIALAFAVLDLTGSPTKLGLVVGARSLAHAAMMLLGGVLADRVRRALLLQGSSYAAAATQLAVGVGLLAGVTSLPFLMVMSALNGIFAAVSVPATSALVSQTVPVGLLRQANAIFRMFTNSAMVIGAAAGGIIAAVAGPPWGIVVDALTFALAGAIFSRVRVSEVPKTAGKRSVLTDLKQGWSEFISHRWLWIVVLQSTVWQVVWAGSIQVLGPTIADESIGKREWGFVLATQALGTIAGGYLALKWQPRKALAFGVVMTGMSALLPLGLAISPELVLLLPIALLVGMAMEQIGVAGSTAMQENIPADRLARVFSYQLLGATAAVPFGQLLAGPLATAFGSEEILLCASVIILVSTLASVSSRSVRALERRVPDRPSSVAPVAPTQ